MGVLLVIFHKKNKNTTQREKKENPNKTKNGSCQKKKIETRKRKENDEWSLGAILRLTKKIRPLKNNSFHIIRVFQGVEKITSKNPMG